MGTLFKQILALFILLALSACDNSNPNEVEYTGGAKKDNTKNDDKKDVKKDTTAKKDTITFNAPEFKTLPTSGVRTYQISIDASEDITSYYLQDAPKWISIEPKTGLLIFKVPSKSDESYSFEIIGESANHLYTSQKISGVSKDINTNIEKELNDAPDLTLNEIETKSSNAFLNSLMIAPNGDDTWDYLLAYNEDLKKNVELVVIDGKTKSVKNIKNIGMFYTPQVASTIGKDGRVYFVTNKLSKRDSSGQVLNIYNPLDNNMTQVQLGEESNLNPITLGLDNNIYISGLHSKLISFNTDTNTTKTITITNSDINTSNASAVCADENYAYLASSKYLVSINTTNDTTQELKKSTNLTLRSVQDGCLVSDASKVYYLKNNVLSEINSNDINENNTSYSTSLLPTRPELFTNGASVTPDGKAHIKVKQQGESTFTRYDYTLDVYPQEVNRLTKLKNGNILASVKPSRGFFLFDTTQKTSTYLGKLDIADYTSLQVGDSVFISGYPNGITYQYYLSNEWTQKSNEYESKDDVLDTNDSSLNPRFVDQLGKEAGFDIAYDSVLGSDGLIYTGGAKVINGKGGGLSTLASQTNAHAGLNELFKSLEIRYMATSKDKRYITMSTYNTDAKTASLNILDTKEGKFEFSQPFDNNISTGAIVGVDSDFILGFVSDEKDVGKTYIYRFNAKNKLYDTKLVLESRFAENTSKDPKFSNLLVKADDGMVYTFLNYRTLVKIDPFTLEITPIGKVGTRDVDDFVIIDNVIYLSGGKKLYTIELK